MFANKPERQDSRGLDREVVIPKRSYTKRAVAPHAGLGAEPEVEVVDKPHNHGKHPVTREAIFAYMLVRKAPQCGKRRAEPLDLFILDAGAARNECRMVPILHAAGGIHAHSLKRAAGSRVYADGGP